MNKKIIIIIAACLVVILIGLGAFFGTANMRAYSAAEKLLASGEYMTAAEQFAALGDYKDSAAKVAEAYTNYGQTQLDAQNYDDASNRSRPAYRFDILLHRHLAVC